MRPYSVLLLLLCCFRWLSSAAQSSSNDKSTAIEARIRAVENGLLPYVPVTGLPGWNLQERMKYYRVPALSIAVIRNYEVEWAKAYGWADTTARTPATPATLFSAGSISKLATDAAALVLVQQGRLGLDAPINTYLKSWQLADNDFTRKRAVSLRCCSRTKAEPASRPTLGSCRPPPRCLPLSTF